MLATGSSAVEPHRAVRHFAVALACGAFASALLMVVLLGVRPDLGQAVLLPMFWVKFAYVASLALTSAIVAMRLSRPGRTLGRIPSALAVPVLGMWMLAAFVFASADPAERRLLLFGGTPTTCPLFIAMLSLPVFLAASLAMKRLAPTRLRLAGGGAGLGSGWLGALVYSWHCQEMAAPFLGIWYLLGVLIPTCVGALLGPRLLRW